MLILPFDRAPGHPCTGISEDPVRVGIDARTIAAMGFGSYLSAFYRARTASSSPDRSSRVLWPGIPRGA